MTKEQEGLLSLLKEIDVICKENNINYYLAGGSCVGAVRHGGFLAWDDDADIHMTRSDYKRFKEIVETTKKNRIVLTKEESEDYSEIHARYMVTDNTTTMLRSSFATSTPQGQFVDIFMLDAIPDGKRKQEKYLFLYYLYIELKTETFTRDSKRTTQFVKAYNICKWMEKHIGKDYLYKRLEKKLFCYPENVGDYYNICSPAAPQPIIEKKIFGTPRYVPFEDTFLPVAENAEKFLREAYGVNWFEVPEINEVAGHVFVQDQELPYTVYENSYTTRFDTQNYLKDVSKRKDIWFSILNQRNNVNPVTRYVKGLPLIYETEGFIKSHKIDLDLWIKEKKYNELTLLFDSIYKYMEESEAHYWNILLVMPEELLYASIYPKVMQGQYSMPQKLIEIYGEEHKLSPRLEKLYEYAEATEKLLESIYTDKDYELAEKIVEEYIEEMPENIYFVRAQIKLLLLEATRENVINVKEKLEKSLSIFPDDPELGKYKGDIYLLCGMGEQARQCYKREEYVLKNGIELKDLKEKVKQLEDKI